MSRVALGTGMLLVMHSVAAVAQIIPPALTRGEVEFGFVHEWFARDFATAPLTEAEWSISSLSITYGAFDWLTIQVQGLASDPDDQAGIPNYYRYTLGAAGRITLYRTGPWSVAMSARYLDTFDRDYSSQNFHKGVETLAGSVQLARSFEVWNQSGHVSLGPVFSNDNSEYYLWDSRQPVEADAGTGWGAGMGVHVVLFDFIAVFGYGTYIDDVAGGVGVALHASKGSF